MKKKKPEQLGPESSGDVLCRLAVLESASVNRDDRSIDLVLATEAAVKTYDFERNEIVNEILHLDGMQIPKQVPMIDSHQGDSVRHVLGSIRDLKRDGDKLRGRAYFARDPESQRTFDDYADGHLTDFSVGATRLEVKYEGRTKHVLRSRLNEGSAVVRGADPNAKVSAALRAAVDPQGMLEEVMFLELKEKMVARGLSKDADEKATMEWLEKELARAGSDGADTAGLLKDLDEAIRSQKQDPDVAKRMADLEFRYAASEKARADADAEVKRIAEIEDLCRQHGVDDKERREWIDKKTAVEEVAKSILRKRATGGTPLGLGSVEFGTSEREKFYNACLDSLVSRAVQAQRLSPHRALEHAKATGDMDAIERSTSLVQTFDKPSEGTRELRHVGLMEMARLFCERSGIRTVGLPSQEIVKRALGIENFVQRSSDGPAFNTTGSFANLLLATTNKTLLAAYDEAPTTYQLWARTAPSAVDFRRLNRIRFGELPDPEVVPENHEYPEKTPGDNRESYQVEKYGEMFSITWEAIVNDDMDALSRIPAMQGAAMRRKINKVVYAVLTANEALSDGVALFHATSHGANLDTDALSEAALDTGFAVMAQQTGLSGSGTILNIQPRFLIVPAGLGAVARRLVSEGFMPTASTGIPLYGAGRARPLVVIEDGQLDANSATKWYLAADPSQVDTVELTFLRGEESPVLDREEGFTTDTVKYKIRQTFAAKAIDYRGLYKSGT